MQAGDFTELAEVYSQNRPNYSSSVLDGLCSLLNCSLGDCDFVDIGAGTGIWTRMVVSRGVKSAIAVEPNAEMRRYGKQLSSEKIRWEPGTAESTGLLAECCDWITMASAFHWANFEDAIREFHRILRPEGRFTALWNPRLIRVNPILSEIEEYLNYLQPGLQRVSSGSSGITINLTDKLLETNLFEDVIFLEGRHVINMSPERYIGIWKSVNDLQAQMGSRKFEEFLKFVDQKVRGQEVIEATYLTRAWSSKKMV